MEDERTQEVCLSADAQGRQHLLSLVKGFLVGVRRAGAIYTGAPVEKDRFIITGSGPLAAALFGQAILDALSGR